MFEIDYANTDISDLKHSMLAFGDQGYYVFKNFLTPETTDKIRISGLISMDMNFRIYSTSSLRLDPQNTKATPLKTATFLLHSYLEQPI